MLIKNKEMYNKNIHDLEWSTRMTNFFYSHEIKTVKDLTKYNIWQLLKMKHFGWKLCEELMGKIKAINNQEI